ncbi:Thioredoxin domain, partial [Dillenia turbinata]
MVILQTSLPLCVFTPPSPIPHHRRAHYNSIKTHQPNLLSSTTNYKFGSSSLFPPRKLLCSPLFGKYIREDYLVNKVTAEEVQELVKGERNVPLIVDFYATWCGPCILMAQELEM